MTFFFILKTQINDLPQTVLYGTVLVRRFYHCEKERSATSTLGDLSLRGMFGMKSLMNKTNRYRITIEEVASNEQSSEKKMVLELEDREDLFVIVENLKCGSGLDEKGATQVGVGLRLLGTMMMQHRKHPLFSDFMPHFKTFMINLKSTIKNNKI
jgi:hypothetical protein